jgi:eukaryotic-like serine/threonine-protein kinase
MTAPSSDSSTLLTPGTQVGAYRIESVLGSGGMADVYYALDRQLDRPVALKILRPSLAADTIYLQRFHQEARAAAALVHPNIVQVYGVGQDNGLRFIAQEYVPGANLRHYLHRDSNPSAGSPAARDGQKVEPGSVESDGAANPGTQLQVEPIEEIDDRQLPIPEVLSIILQVLAALNKSAAAGIVHRDIKPENIMLTNEGDVKVADFGLARLSFKEDPRLTNAGMTLGTPMYMSPEQIQDGTVDIRSDLYSLGVTCFHMLFGRPPFMGDTPLALAMQHVQSNLPEMDGLRSDVPESLKQLLQKLLTKKPENRFGSPLEVLDFLHSHRRDELAHFWPERTVPMPSVAHSLPGPNRATQELKALLQTTPKSTGWQHLWIPLAFGVCLATAGLLGYWTIRQQGMTHDELLQVSEEVFKGIAKQPDVKQQYEWALLDRSSGRIAKWEAVAHYFPKSDSPLNRMYVGLSLLQLARVYQEAGEPEAAMRQLNQITEDPKMQMLVQAFAWLQRASIEHSREDRDREKVQAAVDEALKLREQLSKNTKDVEQLDQTVRSMPPDIELYWTPNPAD